MIMSRLLRTDTADILRKYELSLYEYENKLMQIKKSKKRKKSKTKFSKQKHDKTVLKSFDEQSLEAVTDAKYIEALTQSNELQTMCKEILREVRNHFIQV